jgi:hypothetical protein
MRRTGMLTTMAAVLLLAPLAQAGELAGVKMPDTMEVGGKTLKLNGMGLRKKSIIKVYVGGLYVESPSKDGAALVAADAPKAMRMQFMRGVDKDKVADGFRDGFEANTKDKAAIQKANVDKFLAALPDMKEGDVITYEYLPGKGTTVRSHPAGGAPRDLVMIEGKDFAEVLFMVWLGPKPPSEDLKKGLLGA